MLISIFARRAGVPHDTVRYYVRLGLLRPETSVKGGERPYQVFAPEDVLVVRFIRMAQALGMSLKEIASIIEARRAGGMTKSRRLEVLRGQVDKLEAKAAELNEIRRYLRAKIEWVDGDEEGPPPDVDALEVQSSRSGRRSADELGLSSAT